ncbi:MAG: isoprenylcysteine carboxylmethyltransferase family protein [candidate division WOR-3 bacterium]
MIKFIPISFLFISIILVYLSKNLLTIKFPKIVGLLIIGISLFLIVLGILTLIVNRTTIIPGNKPKKLVKEGIFKFIRNPIYLGDLLLVIGFSLFLQTLTGIFISILFFLILDKIVIPTEERILEETFKDEYLEYKRNVKRWGIF